MSAGYNFTATAAGSFDFEADKTFYIVKENNQVELIHAEATEATAFTTSVTGNLAIARREDEPSGLAKRATFVGCTAARQTLLNTAIASAETYAANAKS